MHQKQSDINVNRTDHEIINDVLSGNTSSFKTLLNKYKNNNKLVNKAFIKFDEYETKFLNVIFVPNVERKHCYKVKEVMEFRYEKHIKNTELLVAFSIHDNCKGCF